MDEQQTKRKISLSFVGCLHVEQCFSLNTEELVVIVAFVFSLFSFDSSYRVWMRGDKLQAGAQCERVEIAVPAGWMANVCVYVSRNYF